MKQKKKGKYIGMAGALVVHLLFVAFLLLYGFTVPQPQEEAGMPVVLGWATEAGGAADLVPVEVDAEPEAQPAAPAEEADLLTQDTEESIAVKPQSPQPETPKPQPEKSEAEKAEEARREAEARAERERKEREEAARRRVAGAFGKGAKMGSRGSSTGSAVQGSPQGNAAEGATTGTGGYGEFNLGGRSLTGEGLPRPAYNVNDEGRVVVSITVNPRGEVIATSIHRQTNTVNTALRRAAEEAARKARFNAVEGLNNQQGTITYYFKLK